MDNKLLTDPFIIVNQKKKFVKAILSNTLTLRIIVVAVFRWNECYKCNVNEVMVHASFKTKSYKDLCGMRWCVCIYKKNYDFVSAYVCCFVWWVLWNVTVAVLICDVKIMCETKQTVTKTFLMCYFMVYIRRINEVANQPTDIVIGYGYKKLCTEEIDVSVK